VVEIALDERRERFDLSVQNSPDNRGVRFHEETTRCGG
jgi:hypothetical protein